MSIDKPKELTYSFPTENDKLIDQCIRDITNHGYELVSKTIEDDKTKIVFKLKK